MNNSGKKSWAALAYKAACLGLLLFAAGCGPKEVGQGLSDDNFPPERDVMAEARYPMDRYKGDGNRLQQKLYIINQPAYMIQLDQAQRSYWQKRSGLKDAEAERARPKQASPFKEF